MPCMCRLQLCAQSLFKVRILTDNQWIEYKQFVTYSQSGRSVLYEFEDYLKIDFHDWMIIEVWFYSMPQFYLNIAFVGRSKGVLPLNVP